MSLQTLGHYLAWLRPLIGEVSLPAATEGAPVLCCAPWSQDLATPISCRTVASEAACAALVASLSVREPALEEDGDVKGASWELALWPWIELPIVFRLGTHIACLILRPLYRTFYAKTACFAWFIDSYIGSSKRPNPERNRPLMLLGLLQLVLSLLDVVLFIYGSYIVGHEIPIAVTVIKIAFGAFFFLHFFILLLKDEFHVREYFYMPLVFIDMLTIPQLLFNAHCGTLTLGFLRSYRALVVFERLEQLNAMGVVHFFPQASEMVRLTVLTSLRFLALITIFSGVMLVVELLGNPPFVRDITDMTPMGDISFFTMFYWVIETISTVGYGDYAPKTVLGRFVTMFCMVSGVVFFAVETSNFAEIWGSQKRGAGKYSPGKNRPHVLVLGSGVQHVDEGLLTEFFAELYSGAHKPHWPGAVILAATDEAVSKLHSFVDIYIEKEAQPLVKVLLGSPMMSQDLSRCQCGSATMVYIFPDTMGQSSMSPDEEDSRNILRALSVAREFPRVPLRLLLLQNDSKERAVSAGIQAPRCYAMGELRAFCFWQSTRCIGWGALVSCLAKTLEPEELAHFHEFPGALPWRKEYAHSVLTRILGFLPSQRYHGSSFLEVAQNAYMEHQVFLFAAQVKGRVRIAPWKSLVDDTTILFALAHDESELAAVSEQQAMRWQDQFYKNRYKNFDQEEALSVSRRGSCVSTRVLRPRTDSIASLQASPKDSLVRRSSDVSQGSSDEEAPVNLKPAAGKLSDADLQRALEARAKKIQEDYQAVPYVTYIEPGSSWVHVRVFIQESRQTWLPHRTPIIILSAAVPERSVLDQLGILDDSFIGCIFGSWKSSQVLLDAGVSKAEVIVCPASEQVVDEGNEGTDIEKFAMVDSDSVMLYQMLDSLHCTWRSVLVFEFKRLQSTALLNPRNRRNRPQALLREASQDGALMGRHRSLGHAVNSVREIGRALNASGPKKISHHANFCTMPRVISGRAFGPVVFGSVMAKANYVPGIAEVIQALIVPEGEIDVTESLQPKQFIWQMRVPQGEFGCTFGEFWRKRLLDEEGPALALGIFRFLSLQDAPHEEDLPVGYPMNNPPQDTSILDTDLVFIFATAEWGKRMYAEGNLRHT